jgi:hypothetical protein
MPSKTSDIKEYRKKYYLENRDHLLLYQRMYAFYKRLKMKHQTEMGSEEELSLSFKEKNIKIKEHEDKIKTTVFKKGNFTLHFD